MSYAKQMQEKRDEAMRKMEELLGGAKTENRAMTEDEQTAFDALESEIHSMDKSIAAEKRALELCAGKRTESGGDSQEEVEKRAFEEHIMAMVENRAANESLSEGKNGAIIPTTIADRIIKEAKDKSPILTRATIYYVGGTLKVPVWGAGEDGNSILVGYSEEFKTITDSAGKFTSVDLTGFMISALTLIGRKLKNNAAFSVVDFVVSQMAEEIAFFVEGELLHGTAGKISGALSTTNTQTAAAGTAITADELIDLQAKVKQIYQKDACWIMHPDTYTALKKLKDGNDRYLLQDDITGDFPYRLLGKPVFLSDNMPKMAAGKKAILYGDMKGLSVKISDTLEIQILREKFAELSALGVISWMELDAKVTDHQRLAVLQMAQATPTPTPGGD